MPVQAPDRSDCLAELPVDEQARSWLAWLAQLLNDRVWTGLVKFDPARAQAAMLHGYPTDAAYPRAALLLARKAHLGDKVLSMSTGSQASDNQSGLPGERSEQQQPEKKTGKQIQHDEPGKQAGEQVLLAIPLTRYRGVRHVLLLDGPAYGPEQLSMTVKLCRWASTWLDRSDTKTESRASSVDDADITRTHPMPLRYGESAELAESVVQAMQRSGSAEAVSMAIANTLKLLYPCQRVSIAIQPSGRGVEALKLVCLSDQVQIDTRKVLPELLIAAMRERLSKDAQSLELHELTDDFPANASLHKEHGGFHAVMIASPAEWDTHSATADRGSYPQPSTRAFVMVEQPLVPATTEQLALLRRMLEPALGALARLTDDQQSDWQRAVQQMKQWMTLRYYGKLTVRQWITGLVATLVIVGLFMPVPLRLTASAAIVAKDLQVIIAPQAGFVSSAHVRAGDIVAQGQVLASLDTRDLQLEADKWHSEYVKNEQALDRALATRDRVELGRLRADAKRILAEQALVEHQIDRSQLHAPFSGVVLSGDLTQRLGSSVELGDTLFTLAATDEYRLVLDVKEDDVGLVTPGQLVRVRMASLPDRTWNARVDTVLPVATITANGNVFRVQAHLLERSRELRPGMEGIAKLHAGRGAFAVVHTRTLREKMRWLLWRTGLIR